MDAAVEIYNRLSVDLLPTPAKSHYVFNLRDLSKCVQGETVKILLPNNSSGVLKCRGLCSSRNEHFVDF